ncbi:hypothetical protein GE061_015017 [Apolygus lucorum]|uniref:Large ribosomal subunit protein bL35m n=1 Tax=Apolygus lucorum TaxID=248454 RepID=A0A8S9XJT1_APOLU|nr:hypothetical protein GE061_015017 [Apolygus lucorum]
MHLCSIHNKQYSKPPSTRALLLPQPAPCLFESNTLKTLRAFSVLNSSPPSLETRSFLVPTSPEQHSTRSLTKYSLQKGKRKSVKAVIRRFFRLDWGIWIRPKCGRHKKIYTKSWRRRRRLRQHVFTNSTQSWLLDTMVTKYWRRPKYYPDDPYNPYHKREEYPTTRRTPQIPVVAS